MKKTLLTIALLLTASLMAACSDNSTDKITLTGSSTVAPLIAEIGKRFEELNPGMRVDVQTGGSSRGINDARKKLADIGMVSRALKQAENDLNEHTIAWDGITLILHKDNPVTALSHEQAIAVYLGHITNWQQLGGENQDIVVINKAEGRSTLELFLQHYALKNSEIKADIIIGDNQQGLKSVAGNPAAIAYVSIGAAAYEAEHGSPIKLLPVNGIEANLANVEKGIFPIARPLNLVTAGSTSELTMRFLRFARSNQVNDLVEKQFFIPVYAN